MIHAGLSTASLALSAVAFDGVAKKVEGLLKFTLARLNHQTKAAQHDTSAAQAHQVAADLDGEGDHPVRRIVTVDDLFFELLKVIESRWPFIAVMVLVSNCGYPISMAASIFRESSSVLPSST
jgi:ribosomal protein S25